MLTEQQIIDAIGVMLKVWSKIKVFCPLFRYFKRMVCDVRDYIINIIRWENGCCMANVGLLYGKSMDVASQHPYSCQVLTRFRPASMRRKIKRRKVNPHRLEPP